MNPVSLITKNQTQKVYHILNRKLSTSRIKLLKSMTSSNSYHHHIIGKKSTSDLNLCQIRNIIFNSFEIPHPIEP